MSPESVEPHAQLETSVDRTLIPPGEPAQRFALLILHAPDSGEGAAHPPLNLSLVVDRSGSMSGDKLKFAKEACQHALRLLHEADRVSLVIYDDEVEILAPSQPATARVREDLMRRLRDVRSGASTDLHGGWEAGCGQVSEHHGNAYVNRVLLLTDGLANVGIVDQEDVVSRVKAQRRGGVGTTTLGVGEDFNQFLLQGMADNGGGHFYFIEKPDQIAAYFKNELGEMLTITARELLLEIGIPSGFSLDLLNDLPHEAGAGTYRADLGDASAGEVRTLALRIGVPASDLHSEIHLPVRVVYTDAACQAVELSGPVLSFLVASAGACEEQPTDETVLLEAGRLLAERAKTQALAYLYKDERAAARGALEEVIATLQKMLPAELAAPLVRELEELLQRTDDQLLMDAHEAKLRHHTSYRAQHSRKI